MYRKVIISRYIPYVKGNNFGPKIMAQISYVYTLTFRKMYLQIIIKIQQNIIPVLKQKHLPDPNNKVLPLQTLTANRVLILGDAYLSPVRLSSSH